MYLGGFSEGNFLDTTERRFWSSPGGLVRFLQQWAQYPQILKSPDAKPMDKKGLLYSRARTKHLSEPTLRCDVRTDQVWTPLGWIMNWLRTSELERSKFPTYQLGSPQAVQGFLSWRPSDCPTRKSDFFPPSFQFSLCCSFRHEASQPRPVWCCQAPSIFPDPLCPAGRARFAI